MTTFNFQLKRNTSQKMQDWAINPKLKRSWIGYKKYLKKYLKIPVKDAESDKNATSNLDVTLEDLGVKSDSILAILDFLGVIFLVRG